RGASRGGKDIAAAAIAAIVFDKRMKDKAGTGAFVRNDPHFLPGSIVFGVSGWRPDDVAKPDAEALALLVGVAEPAITQAEFDAAKKEFLATYAARDRLSAWLDIDTYKLPSIKDEAAAFEKTSLKDVQAFASELKTRGFAKILLASPIPADSEETPATQN